MQGCFETVHDYAGACPKPNAAGFMTLDAFIATLRDWQEKPGAVYTLIQTQLATDFFFEFPSCVGSIELSWFGAGTGSERFLMTVGCGLREWDRKHRGTGSHSQYGIGAQLM